MRQAELSASSTRRAPSTPTAPDSVGRPPRRAIRNSLSQRLSRLVSTAGAADARGVRAALLGVAITGSVANFCKKVSSGWWVVDGAFARRLRPGKYLLLRFFGYPRRVA